MPNLPMVEKAFETLLNSIITLKPPDRMAKVRPQLQTLLSHPTIVPLLPALTASVGNEIPSNIVDLTTISKSLQSLSKAVESLQKASPPSKQTPPPNAKQQKGKVDSKSPPRSYSVIAGSRPPNPSLVVDLANLEFDAGSRPKPEAICCLLNEKLHGISPPQVQLAAIRWTAAGNLVVAGGPAATPLSLQLAAPHISAILTAKLQLPSSTPLPPPRANVKWSKIIINGVPTGASPTRGPYTPSECHAALTAINPSYASLTITQQPSWVQPPSSYTHGSTSSLSVAFEDPSGEKLKVILAERYLFLFGNRATVKKWKYRQSNTKTKEPSNSSIVKHPQDNDTPDDEDVEQHLTPAPANTRDPPDHVSFSFSNTPTPPSPGGFQFSQPTSQPTQRSAREHRPT